MTDIGDGWPTEAEFRALGGLDEWRLLPQAFHAHWATGGFSAAAEFVGRIAAVAVEVAQVPDLDVRAEGVTAMVASDAFGRITAADVALARGISAAARELGLRSDPSRLLRVQVAVAEAPGVETRAFWRALTGYAARGDEDASDPLRRAPNLWFHPLHGGASGRGRIHLDLAFPAEYSADRIRRALRAGGRIVDDSHDTWITLASPDNHGVDVPAPPREG